MASFKKQSMKLSIELILQVIKNNQQKILLIIDAPMAEILFCILQKTIDLQPKNHGFIIS